MEVSKLLIKQAKVIDAASDYHQQTVDILIENEAVVKIGDNLEADDAKVISAPNLHISPGWFDLRANFFDPGNEERETLQSGMNAAIKGGFTAVALSPQTSPAIDSKADIEYIYQSCEGWPVNLYPYGSITKGLEGKELSEMYDMHQAGAVGFSHGKIPLQNAAVTKLALQYAKSFAPSLHLMPLEEEIARGGQVHEGEVSTYLGLKGIPTVAEEINVLRDVYLADYAETGIHLMGISSFSLVNLLKHFKRNGSFVSADTAVANLVFTENDLSDYNTNFKVLPPLRAESDRQALLEAVKSNYIQVICSDHTPVDIENKKCEFEHADWGMISLQTLFGALGTIREELDLERAIEAISRSPRQTLNMESPVIKEGSWAEFTLFDPEMEWTFEKSMIESKSHNSPWIGRKLKGKALGTINNGFLVWMAES